MLLESGVPIVTALESVTLVVDNSALQEEVRKMALKVKSGMSLTQAIKASALFPEMAVDLIAVGQESGKLEKGLYKLAANCERSSPGIGPDLCDDFRAGSVGGGGGHGGIYDRGHALADVSDEYDYN